MKRFWKSLLDFLEEDGWVYVMTVLGVVATFLISFVFLGITCNRQAKAMNMPHVYRPLTGCLISPAEGEWIPIQNYRYFGD